MKKSNIIVYIISALLLAVSYIIYLTCYVTMPASFYSHSLHLVAFLYLLVPLLYELIFKKDLPLSILIGFVLFIFASQVLGTAYNGYLKFPPLDIIVHAFSATLVVLFVGSLVKKHILNLNIFHQIIYLFGTALIVGVVWEIIEFCGDLWFGMNNQVIRQHGVSLVGQEAVKDTMIDLIADSIGAIIGICVHFLPNIIGKKRTK